MDSANLMSQSSDWCPEPQPYSADVVNTSGPPGERCRNSDRRSKRIIDDRPFLRVRLLIGEEGRSGARQ